ncbi:TRAP transporter small permease subunit [Pseudooceanicola sp. CBS1P-1]|uniref:TRAP transporter small permease protein n=1 Tax=Pseudooceanicola albus TaxID=2692189 RepID=A0A6L7G3X2_9RHOB|nr:MULTISPECIES: TRAP transporter small permease subunit [Pseudooceanicola]MBT9385336.1 TRAP transporter small permease subunit [Pseudooceanicola endophyticus]MXN18805.1 TRAP transporter small permease subunit [Pseudooceanicola albus]
MIFFADALYALSERLNTIAKRIAAYCFLGMLLVMMLQVVARYIFSSPPFWTEELARWLMVWGGLLGASCAFHTHADPAMVHPPSHVIWRQKAQVVARFLASWIFFAPVLYYTWPYVERQIGRTSEGLGVSTAWMATALPVAIFLILLHGLAGLGALISPRVLSKEIAFAKEAEANMLE